MFYTSYDIIIAVQDNLEKLIQKEKSYLIQFSYKGPTSSYGEDDESNHALDKAIKIVANIFDEERISNQMSYCWPDGSLFYTIETILDYNILLENLNQLFSKSETVRPKNIFQNEIVSVVAIIEEKEVEFNFTSNLNFMRKYHFNVQFFGKLYEDARYHAKETENKLYINLKWQFIHGRLSAYLDWTANV